MHQECTVTTNAHPPAPLERTCTHPHKLAMTSAYLTGPFSHILLRARHHGDASRDSHRSATRGHCQCAAECCRGSLGHAGVTPTARGLRLGHAGVIPTARGLRLGHAGVIPTARGLRLGHAGVTPTARGLRLGHAGVTRAAPHSGAADHERRLRASCQTVGIAAECVVTVRVISSLRVSVALILCG